MKSSSERMAAMLHSAAVKPATQPRMPLPTSWGVRVALQTSVWACAGAPGRGTASDAARTRSSAARRGRAPLQKPGGAPDGPGQYRHGKAKEKSGFAGGGGAKKP